MDIVRSNTSPTKVNTSSKECTPGEVESLDYGLGLKAITQHCHREEPQGTGRTKHVLPPSMDMHGELLVARPKMCVL